MHSLPAPRFVKKVRDKFVIRRSGDQPFVHGLFATPGKAVAAAAAAWGIRGRAAIHSHFYKKPAEADAWERVAFGVYKRGPGKFTVRYFADASRSTKSTRQFSTLKAALQFRKLWARFDDAPRRSEMPAPLAPAPAEVAADPEMPDVSSEPAPPQKLAAPAVGAARGKKEAPLLGKHRLRGKGPLDRNPPAKRQMRIQSSKSEELGSSASSDGVANMRLSGQMLSCDQDCGGRDVFLEDAWQ